MKASTCSALVAACAFASMLHAQTGPIVEWYSSTTPGPPGNFTAIAAGDFNAFAIRADGTLAAWGFDIQGQMSVPSGTYVAIASNKDVDHGFCLAIRTDHTLVGWGYPLYGITSPPSGTFKSVDAAFFWGVGLRTDGTIAVWGAQGTPIVDTVPPGQFIAIAAGQSHALALRADGSVVAWGNDSSGALNVPSGTFVSIAAGLSNSFAIRTDGSIAAWGSNSSSLVSGVPSGSFTMVSVGIGRAYALRSNGTIAGWGGTTPPYTPGNRFARIAIGSGSYLGILTCPANCDNSTTTPLLTANDFFCFLSEFANGTSYANCDGSSSPPLLTANDFQCFLNQFAVGCP